jgi:hypothetical protein
VLLLLVLVLLLMPMGTLHPQAQHQPLLLLLLGQGVMQGVSVVRAALPPSLYTLTVH